MLPIQALLAPIIAKTNDQNEDPLVLADSGASPYKIVLSKDASPSEKWAAEDLQSILKEMTGASLPIVDDAAEKMGPEIVLGDNRRLRAAGARIDVDRLGREGFTIKGIGQDLLIAGGKPRGTMYGVYTLLEDYLGCRWFAPGVTRIPQRKRLTVAVQEDTQVPPLEYREPFFTSAFDGDWCARNKMNGAHSKLADKHGGKVTYSHFVHTFDHLVPPQKYFDDHPEYFSLIDGKRTHERAQLCLTNPDVLQLTIDGVREWIEGAPDADIYSVSQNDTHVGYCACEKCAALDQAEGSHAGSLIHFVNQVAEAIGRDYPDKAIDTLAYQYSRKPPKHVRPLPNVIVRLCSIECCFAHPLDECSDDQNVSFVSDIEGWYQLTNRLYIWDYVTNFAHYIMPFPNLRVLQPNVKFFVDHGVKGIFEEGSYGKGGGGEMAELRSYVLAKALWDPDYDQERAINEFLEGFFAGAADPIREYLDLLHQPVEAEEMHVRIYEPPKAPYYPDGFVRRAQELFEEAERCAANDEVLWRVRLARLPVIYLQMARQPETRERLLPRFMALAREAGIGEIREAGSIEHTPERLAEF